jgi:hypothetical protein
MVNTVTLRQTAYAGMQRQWQADYGADSRGKHAEARADVSRYAYRGGRAGKGKLSGIVKQAGRQIQVISM